MRGTPRLWETARVGVKVRLLMRQAEQDGEHIWLRQSVTFTVAGQTRTVEIAIPLRPGATADEVEALLGEADAGMERLSRRLDERVAALLGAPPSPSPVPAAPVGEAPPAAPVPAVSEPGPAPEPALEPAADVVSSPAVREVSESVVPERLQPAPATPQRPPARGGRDTSPATPARPTPQPAAQPAPRPTPPVAPVAPVAPAVSSPAPARARASGPLAAAPAQGQDLTRAGFISAAGELGLSVKQAMERLGVRSLEGLNLREALEALRRQAVRDETQPQAPATPAPATPAPSTPAPATPTTPARPAASPPAAPRYFDEEDDLDVSFSVDGDEEDLEESFAPYATGGPHDGDDLDPLDDIDELDLDDDDVPDFGPPPSSARSSSSAGAAPRRHTAPHAPAAAPTAPQPEETAIAETSLAGASGDRARALQLIGQMRGARGGGAPSGYQRAAYRNVIARELGEPEAASLVRGLWRTTPDRLSAEQLDVLLSWGKQDTFGEDVAIVLAELRAERERASAASEPAPASEAQRPAPRPRGAGAGRGAPGGR